MPCRAYHTLSTRPPSELIDLLLLIPQLLQHARQLPLIRRTRLVPADGLVQARRATHEDLDVLPSFPFPFPFGAGLRQHRLQQLLGDAAPALRPALGRGVVEDVEGAEAVRVRVFELLELGLEQDVGFGEVAEDEGDFCFVAGVFEDGADELVHSVFLVSRVCVHSGFWFLSEFWREGRGCVWVETYGVMPVPPAINAI